MQLLEDMGVVHAQAFLLLLALLEQITRPGQRALKATALWLISPK